MRPGPGRIEEVEAERPATLGEGREGPACGGAILLQPADLGELRLRLACLRLLVPEALHEAFEARDVLRDTVGRLLGSGGPCGLLAPPLVPGACEEVRSSRGELEHRGGDCLEEPAVVRNEDHRRIEGGELGFEPLEAFDVEVIRRLVEEQQIGIDRERASERGSSELTAGERGELPIQTGLVEPQATCGTRCPLAPGPAAGMLEPRLCVRVAA